LPAGQSCNFEVSFEPRGMGTKNEQLRVDDSASNSPQIVSLQGVGQQ